MTITNLAHNNLSHQAQVKSDIMLSSDKQCLLNIYLDWIFAQYHDYVELNREKYPHDILIHILL